MQRTLFAVVVLALVAVSAAALSEEDQFVQYIKKYEKKYTTSEMFARFNAFRANLVLVNAHNALFEAGESSFTMEMNALADLTQEEYRARLGLRHTDQRDDEAVGVPMTESADLVVPDSWDWRAQGAVNPVQDQGGCGSCWAFSATASLEGTDFLQTKKLKKFSEQMCVDCVNDGTCNCTVGGEMHDCFVQVHNQGGEMLEKDYPYTQQSEGICHFDESKKVGTFGDYVNVTQGDEQALKAAAYQMVISVGIDASSLDFQAYQDGVYDVEDCKTKWEDLDHGVAVVGYGTDPDTKKDYWLVRNSWNADWGKQGYIWMVRNKKNQCGIATDASYVPPQKSSDARRHRRTHH